jgi:hypothetical protein
MPIIKTHKTSVPAENGRDLIAFVQKIQVDKDGRFTIQAPEHLHNTLALVSKEREVQLAPDAPASRLRALPFDVRNGVVGPCQTLEEVEYAWKDLMARAREFLTNSARKKVIKIDTEMSVRIFRDNRLVLGRNDVSFSKVSPLLGLDYTVCYQVGPDLVDEDNRYLAQAEKATVVPYTEEREAFLAKIVHTLEQAALQLDEFCTAVQEDPLAIDTLIHKGMLLTYAPGEGDQQ